MLMRSAVANQAHIHRRVKEVARNLAPDVVRIRYAITLDLDRRESHIRPQSTVRPSQPREATAICH